MPCRQHNRAAAAAAAHARSPSTPHPRFRPSFHPRPPAAAAPGLGKGGQQIQSCRKAYLSAIQLLVQLANLQTAFMTLDTALKVTNRRVNALENVVKPKIENTISYIKVRRRWVCGAGRGAADTHGVQRPGAACTQRYVCVSAWEQGSAEFVAVPWRVPV